MAEVLEPMTVEHYARWAGGMTLDTGRPAVLEDWQLEEAEPILEGVQEVVIEAPEGNGKTTSTALLILYIAHYRKFWEILVAAASKEQAMQLFQQAKGFQDRDERLLDVYAFQGGHRRIKALFSGSTIQIKAADENTVQGGIFDLALIDEMSRQRDMSLWRTWYGKVAVKRGQIVGLSNAGEPGSEYEAYKSASYEKAVEIEERGPGFDVARRPGSVFFRHGLKPGDDTTDLELVKEANPLGHVTLEKLELKLRSASMTTAQWLRMTCGIASRTIDQAMPPERWKGIPVGVIPAGEPVWIGLDLGWANDTTAIVPFWMPEPDQRVIGIPEILVPPREPGVDLEPEQVRDKIRDVHARNPIEVAVLDIAAEGRVMAEWLASEIGCRVVSYGQSHEPQCVAREKFMESLRAGWIRRPPMSAAEAVEAGVPGIETKGGRTLAQHFANAVARVVLGTRSRFDRHDQSRQGNQALKVVDGVTATVGVHAVADAELEPQKPKGPKINLENVKIRSLAPA